MLHLARKERCVNAYQGSCPHCGGNIRITEKLRMVSGNPRHPLACVSTNRVALCKERAPGALHVRQGQHKGLRIK